MSRKSSGRGSNRVSLPSPSHPLHDRASHLPLRRLLPILLVVVGLGALAAAFLLPNLDRWTTHRWSERELSTIKSFSLESLPPLPPDPSNRYADDARAARLGRDLFFDPRFSANGEVSCATCHQPERAFTDGLARSVGINLTNRSAMSIVGSAYSPWLFHDGRADSLWAQALGPLENPVEHGGSRTRYAHIIAEYYRAPYEEIFGPLPDLSSLPDDAGPLEGPAGEAWGQMTTEQQEGITRVYVNMGKAIAAYERKLLPGPSRLDAYANAAQKLDIEGMRAALNSDEAAGLRLFIGKARCIECHNGPLLTNNVFQNVGTPAAEGLEPDQGRIEGVELVLDSPFNCLGKYSDASEDDCKELNFTAIDTSELIGAFRTPSLRSVSQTAPYMHAGQYETLEEVVAHYNNPPHPAAGHNHMEPLDLSQREMDQLVAFLKSLDSPPSADEEWLRAP